MVAARRGAFAEEAAEVEVLNANVEKMKALRKKIAASHGRLEESGRIVGEALGPMYANTQQLQVTNRNVDAIQEQIEKLKAPLDSKDREERILRSRPDKVGFQEYMNSLDRTSRALRGLRKTNIKSNQKAVTDLSELLQVGIQSLEQLFRDVLRRESAPIEPLRQLTTKQDFPRLHTKPSAQLRTINQNIASYASQVSQPGELSPSARAYALERGQYITLSLSNLATATMSTARKVNAEAVYKQGSNGISLYAQGLQGMYTAEYDSITNIFTREEWGPVLQATCQESLAAFAKTLQKLASHVQENLMTDCYLAYEVVDVVSKASVELESKTGELKYAFSDALKPMREVAKSSLPKLLNDVRTKIQQMQALPQDGASVPIASDTMTRLQLMTGYLPPVCSLLRSLGDGGWTAPNTGSSSASIPTVKSFDVGADGQQLFSHYATDTIDALLTNLDSRGKALLRGRSLQGVFLANNISIVERMIHTSELSSLLNNGQNKLDQWRKTSIRAYMDAWKEPSTHLLDQITVKATRPTSTGQAVDSAAVLKALSSKDKDNIKEKFRNFNVSFDEIVAKHKAYKMEGEVRRLLGKEVQIFMEPLYNRFWDRYHEVDKGKGKYVKYSKAEMSAVLSSLA
ncbi:hypothetical protein B0A50_02875 [Salinomyces thailandicus]|uniref:Exocyst complex protein EXO70 n=1 Tax=Salinomyces thailandicus TaxID=706561 RepID=A0A4U0U6S9_9PEZI|nr:hypothetical protein B0A50_02875 [Salinomyces thailandica]